MADAKEAMYNSLELMLYAIFELGRTYESKSMDDMDVVHRTIRNCMSWVKAEKVVNVRVETKIVKGETDAQVDKENHKLHNLQEDGVDIIIYDDEEWRCSECGHVTRSPQSPGCDRCRGCGCKSIGTAHYEAYRIDVADNPCAQIKNVIKISKHRRCEKAWKRICNRFSRRSG